MIIESLRTISLALSLIGMTGCLIQNSFPTAKLQYPEYAPGTASAEPSPSSWCVATSGAVTRKNTVNCLKDGGQVFDSISAAKSYSEALAEIETAPINDKAIKDRSFADAIDRELAQSAKPPEKPVQRTACTSSDWRHSASRDEMTGKTQGFATSKGAQPTRRMDFPYRDVHGWLGFGCDGENEWAFIGFSTSPNITDDDTEDGYNVIRTRIKWDDEIETVRFTQDWGSKFLDFSNDKRAIDKFISANKVLLELRWHGSGSVYFPFSLRCSTNAILDAREICNNE